MINWDEVKSNGWGSREDGYFRILSIDGGGIRGIFPAKYLEQIEATTGKCMYEYFDLIAGTSTGGIIALALSLGIRAEIITKLYVDYGREIFEPSNVLCKFLPFLNKGFFSNKYKNDNLINHLKNTFESAKIKDAKAMLCIPSMEHHKAQPKVYKTPHHKKFHFDAECDMWKVALATSAAPTYFKPASVNDDCNDCKIDGGMWANNPVMVGIAEAVHLGYSLDKIKVLSIGTGHNFYKTPRWVAKIGGAVLYREKLIDLFMNGQTIGAVHTASYLLDKRFRRIDFDTNRRLELDSVSKEDIDTLVLEATQSFVNTFNSDINVNGMFFNL